VHPDLREEFRVAICRLLQPQALLRNLELSDCENEFDTSQQFTRLLTAVESSHLDRFAIGGIESRECCLALIGSIPKMHLRSLDCSLAYYLEDMKGGIMGAIKQNPSLHTVHVDQFSRWLNDGKDEVDIVHRSKRIPCPLGY
jgi:hypothetical protein